MATHSSILAWRIPRTESLVGYSPWGCKESDTTERLHFLILSISSKYMIIVITELYFLIIKFTDHFNKQ